LNGEVKANGEGTVGLLLLVGAQLLTEESERLPDWIEVSSPDMDRWLSGEDAVVHPVLGMEDEKVGFVTSGNPARRRRNSSMTESLLTSTGGLWPAECTCIRPKSHSIYQAAAFNIHQQSIHGSPAIVSHNTALKQHFV